VTEVVWYFLFYGVVVGKLMGAVLLLIVRVNLVGE